MQIFTLKVSERFIFTQCLKWTPLSWRARSVEMNGKKFWQKVVSGGRGKERGLQISKVFCLLPPACQGEPWMYNGGKEITFHHFEPIMQTKDNGRASKLKGISPAFQSKSHKIVRIALDTTKSGDRHPAE